MQKTGIKAVSVLFACMLIAQLVYAQDPMKQKVSIVAKQKDLGRVLDELSNQTGLYFSYNTAEIDNKQRITLIARRQPLAVVLKKICDDLNISYTLMSKQLILKPKPVLPEVKDETVPKPKLFTISGYLKDAESQELLPGAVVVLKNAKHYRYASTNAYGFYALSVPPGNYEISYSYLGYEKLSEQLSVFSDKQKSANLKMNITELNIVLVTDKDSRKSGNMHPLRSIEIPKARMQRMSVPGSSGDAVKSLQSVPGVNFFGAGSAMYNVRGGEKGENIVYLDDAPVYNPAHLFGLYSAVAPDAVKSVRMYKSDFPAEYGGYLSSYLDIRTKDGDMTRWGFSGHVTPLMSEYAADGPIIKERSSLFADLRFSHLNYLYAERIPELSVDFSDLHLKYNHIFNRKHRLFVAFYSGADEFKIGDRGIKWNNTTLSLRKNRLWSDKLFSNAALYLGGYTYNLYFSLFNDTYVKSEIMTLSFKQDFNWLISSNHRFSWGYRIALRSFDPGNVNFEAYNFSAISAGSVLDNVIYAGGESHLSENWTVKYGLRFANWNNYGPATVYDYRSDGLPIDTAEYGAERYHTKNVLVPRLSVMYQASNRLTFSLAYDRNVQFLHFLSNSLSPFTGLEVWLPSGPNISPRSANQYSAGANYAFNELSFTTGVYYKHTKNRIDYANQPDMFLNPHLDSELYPGKAQAYGAEFSLMKERGLFRFTLNYVYARVINRTTGVNGDRPYPAVWDRPHNIYLNIAYSLTDRLLLSMAFVFVSGNRFSSPTGFYYYQNRSIPIYSEKNNDKLPNYHRADFALQWQIHKQESNRFRHFLSLSVYNVYARNNVISVNFNKTETDNGSYVVPSDFWEERELLPTAFTMPGLLPTVSYRFMFR